MVRAFYKYLIAILIVSVALENTVTNVFLVQTLKKYYILILVFLKNQHFGIKLLCQVQHLLHQLIFFIMVY